VGAKHPIAWSQMAVGYTKGARMTGWRKRQITDDDDIQEYVRPWIGLTEEEAEDIWRSCAMRMPTEFAKALEAKLKEKNT